MPTLRPLLASLLCVATLSAAAIAPEFGASISAAKGDPSFRLADLRGKVTLILFIQSWCPGCNGWSPALLKQVQEGYAQDPRVTLLAIKTDSDAASAKQYLRKQGADLDRWLVLGDAEAAYVMSVLGRDSLWDYAVVAPDGTLVDSGQTSAHRTAADGSPRYILGQGLGDTYAPDVKPVLTTTYPPALARAVWLAEAGCVADAIAAAKTSGAKEATAFTAEVLAAAGARMTALAATVGDASVSASARFPAFQALRQLATQLRGSEPAKVAAKAVAEAQKDKAIKRECDAERAWTEMQAKLMKIPVEKRAAALGEALPQFAKAYAGTVYGDQAAAAH